jgi:hypothetical protein
MFCRQLGALIAKNLTLKCRAKKQTAMELFVPLLCGVLVGLASVQPNDAGEVTVLDYFQEISFVYLIALILITVSFAASCVFILNQVVVDKENKMRESLKIMSTTRSAYTMSYFLTQALFAVVTALFVTVGIMWKF